MRNRITPTTVLLYSTLVLLAAAFLLPAYLTLVTSLKVPGDISLPQSWDLPPTVNWASFSEAVALLKPNIINSLILTVSATILSTLLGSLPAGSGTAVSGLPDTE